MTNLAILAQVILALGIFNVWVIRRNRPTPYRPDGALDIEEEFARYGLPEWAPTVVGTTKLALAALLLIGVVYAEVALLAATGMAALMVGAVWAHVRVRDPLMKAVPALGMLTLSLVVVVARVS